MSDKNIYGALSKAFAAIVSAINDNSEPPKLKAQYENRPFTTPNNEPWLRLQILDINDEASTLGQGGLNRREGLMRITVFTPKGSGLNAAYDAIDTVRATIKAGATLTHDGTSVRINSASNRAGTDESAWFSRIIDVNFYSYETR